MFASVRSSPLRSSRRFVHFSICVAMFSDGFTYGLVAPVTPFLLQDENLFIRNNRMENSTLANVTVALTAYAAQFTISLLIAAFSMADFCGGPLCAVYVDQSNNRRIPWCFGIFLIAAGGLLFGLHTNIAMLIGSRILHGFSSSVLYTVGLAVLVDTVEKDEVGKWMGMATSCNNVGLIISPLFGGILYDKSGKMAVFGTMIGLGTIDIVLRIIMKEPKKDGTTVVEALNGSSSTVSSRERAMANDKELDLSITVSPHTPRVDVEATNNSRQMNRFAGIVALLKSPRLLAAMSGVFINEVVIASLCATLPLFVHSTFHWTALPAGLLFLCLAVPTGAGYLAGALSDRFGARWVTFSGFALTAPMLMLLRVVRQDSTEQKVLICVLLTLIGATLVLFLSPLGAEFFLVAEEKSEAMGCDLYASSFSLMNCSMALAGLLGSLAAGGLVNAIGWKGMTAVLGGFCALGCIPCLMATGNQRRVPCTRPDDNTIG